MKTIGAAQFKEQCLSLLDSLTTEGIVVTKHGKPVARVLPFAIESKDLIGILRGKVKILNKKDDLLSTGIKWNAES